MNYYGIKCKKCGFDKWEVWRADNNYSHKYKACCACCDYERPYIPRKPKTDAITPSQQGVLDKVEYCMLLRADKNHNLQKTVKLDKDAGFVSFIFKLTEPALRGEQTVIGTVGRRGAVNIVDAHSRYSDLTKHYQQLMK